MLNDMLANIRKWPNAPFNGSCWYSINGKYNLGNEFLVDVPLFGNLDPLLIKDWFEFRKNGYPVQFVVMVGLFDDNGNMYHEEWENPPSNIELRWLIKRLESIIKNRERDVYISDSIVNQKCLECEACAGPCAGQVGTWCPEACPDNELYTGSEEDAHLDT